VRKSSENDAENRGVVPQEQSIRFAAWQRRGGGQNVQHGNASIGISTLLRSLGSTRGSAVSGATNGLGVANAVISRGADIGEVEVIAENGALQDGNAASERER